MSASLPGIPGSSGGGVNNTSYAGFPGYSTGSPVGNMNFGSLTGQQNIPGWSGFGPFNSQINSDLYKGMGDEYGSHLGSAIAYYIDKGGGFNKQALQAIFNAMNPTIARSLSTLDAGTGVSGTRFGSAHDFATQQYLNDVYLQQGEIAAQEYDQAQNRILQLLSGAGNAAASSSNGPGMLSSLLGMGMQAAPAIGAGLGASAGGASTMSSIATALMML